MQHGFGPMGGSFGGPPPGGQLGAPPGGVGGPMWGGPANPQLASKLQSWLVLSILSIFFGCCLFGAIGAYFAHEGKKALDMGRVAEAESRLRTARGLAIASFVVFGLSMASNIVMQVWLTG